MTLLPQRLRKVPTQGWSWIDRRFLREYGDALSRDAIALYFFLTAVADKHGLSYYGDANIGARLRMETSSVSQAREELLEHDLIAYARPLYQVLSLPQKPTRHSSSEPELAGDVLAEVFRRSQKAGAKK